jgi:3-oxoadipate enol-lactonase
MERFIDVPGGRLCVVDEGDGLPVVLVHAGIVDLRAWDAFAPHLVVGGFRVVRYDTRSWGRSTTAEVDFSNRADLVAVLDACGIGRAALVGNSRGGQITFDTAIEFPDRVIAVVGVGAGLGGFEGHPTPEEIALFEEMDRLESADAKDPDAIAEIDVRVWVDGPGQPPDRVDPAIREAVRAMDHPSTRPAASSVDRSRWTPRRRSASPTSAARSSPWPACWTSPTWRRRRNTSRPTPRTRAPCSSRTSPT